MNAKYYTVGSIIGTHGLRGDVKVFPRTDFPKDRFSNGSRLWIRKVGTTPFQELVVVEGRQNKKIWLVRFDGLSSINDVEHFKGMELCVTESALTKLPDNTYYIHQLLGLRVESDDGRYVGELVDVLSPGANDVYVVRGPLQKSDVLLPAIPSCVLSVDISEKTMLVHLLAGLLDEPTRASEDETC